MRTKILMIVFYFSIIGLYAQINLNAYKYIIVPKKFDFQKSEDEYQLNSLTKFLFNKEGFTTLLERNKVPQDMYENPCLGLKVDAINQSSMFSSKIILELTDCRNNKIFTSVEGKSKEKEYKKGYQEAIRKAFQSIKELEYSYDASLSSPKTTKVESNNKPELIIESQPKVEEVASVEKQIEFVEEVVEEDITTNEQLGFNDIEVTNMTVKDVDVLYAQAKSFGFQLVDSVPSVVYLLQKSSLKDVYILKNKNGIIYKKSQKWIVEYYDNDELVQKELNIKF